MATLPNISRVLLPSFRLYTNGSCFNLIGKSLHTSPPVTTFSYMKEEKPSAFPQPKRWPLKNHIVVPPQKPGELVNRAECYHFRANVKYSPKKMWFICHLVEGLPVDEALKQLSFVPKKGAFILKEVIEEAREMALKEHNFEFKSNMFLAECRVTKGLVIKGYRKHAYYRFGEIRYFHVHLFVRLVEGEPPAEGLKPNPDNETKLKDYLDDLKRRNIKFSL